MWKRKHAAVLSDEELEQKAREFDLQWSKSRRDALDREAPPEQPRSRVWDRVKNMMRDDLDG